jgi:hypothetical protein
MWRSYSLMTSALDRGVWSASRPGSALALGKNPGTHCTKGWVGPRAGLDTEGTGRILFPLPGIEPQSPGRVPQCNLYEPTEKLVKRDEV